MSEDEYTPGRAETVHPDDAIVHGKRWREERDKYRAALLMIHQGHIAPRTLAGLALYAPTWEPSDGIRR